VQQIFLQFRVRPVVCWGRCHDSRSAILGSIPLAFPHRNGHADCPTVRWIICHNCKFPCLPMGRKLQHASCRIVASNQRRPTSPLGSAHRPNSTVGAPILRGSASGLLSSIKRPMRVRFPIQDANPKQIPTCSTAVLNFPDWNAVVEKIYFSLMTGIFDFNQSAQQLVCFPRKYSVVRHSKLPL
jgi:hypothetical protein